MIHWIFDLSCLQTILCLFFFETIKVDGTNLDDIHDKLQVLSDVLVEIAGTRLTLTWCQKVKMFIHFVILTSPGVHYSSLITKRNPCNSKVVSRLKRLK